MSFGKTGQLRVDAEVLSFLNPKEVARKLGCSTATVNRWVREGKPGFPVPTTRGFREWEVDRFVADSKITCRDAQRIRVGA